MARPSVSPHSFLSKTSSKANENKENREDGNISLERQWNKNADKEEEDNKKVKDSKIEQQQNIEFIRRKYILQNKALAKNNSMMQQKMNEMESRISELIKENMQLRKRTTFRAAELKEYLEEKLSGVESGLMRKFGEVFVEMKKIRQEEKIAANPMLDIFLRILEEEPAYTSTPIASDHGAAGDTGSHWGSEKLPEEQQREPFYLPQGRGYLLKMEATRITAETGEVDLNEHVENEGSEGIAKGPSEKEGEQEELEDLLGQQKSQAPERGLSKEPQDIADQAGPLVSESKDRYQPEAKGEEGNVESSLISKYSSRTPEPAKHSTTNSTSNSRSARHTGKKKAGRPKKQVSQPTLSDARDLDKDMKTNTEKTPEIQGNISTTQKIKASKRPEFDVYREEDGMDRQEQVQQPANQRECSQGEAANNIEKRQEQSENVQEDNENINRRRSARNRKSISYRLPSLSKKMRRESERPVGAVDGITYLSRNGAQVKSESEDEDKIEATPDDEVRKRRLPGEVEPRKRMKRQPLGNVTDETTNRGGDTGNHIKDQTGKGKPIEQPKSYKDRRLTTTTTTTTIQDQQGQNHNNTDQNNVINDASIFDFVDDRQDLRTYKREKSTSRPSIPGIKLLQKNQHKRNTVT